MVNKTLRKWTRDRIQGEVPALHLNHMQFHEQHQGSLPAEPEIIPEDARYDPNTNTL